jgi:hypothetical protein
MVLVTLTLMITKPRLLLVCTDVMVAVGKILGNIPKQSKMDSEQEQTFTNGINKGRKLEQERVLALWSAEMLCDCEDAMGHLYRRINNSIVRTSADNVVNDTTSKSVLRRLEIQEGKMNDNRICLNYYPRWLHELCWRGTYPVL